MEALVLLMFVGAVLVLPLLALKVLLQLAFGLVLLPIKLLGGLVKAVVGLVGGLFGLVFGGALAMGSVLLVVGAVLLLPFLPFLILGGLVYMAVKASRPVHRAA